MESLFTSVYTLHKEFAAQYNAVLIGVIIFLALLTLILLSDYNDTDNPEKSTLFQEIINFILSLSILKNSRKEIDRIKRRLTKLQQKIGALLCIMFCLCFCILLALPHCLEVVPNVETLTLQEGKEMLKASGFHISISKIDYEIYKNEKIDYTIPKKNEIGLKKKQIKVLLSEGIDTFGRNKYKVNDTYEFGRYPQTASGEIQPIIWRILDVDSNLHLLQLLSEKILDHQVFSLYQYSTGEQSNDWDTSNIKHWLNDTFLNNAFNDEEKDIIEYNTREYARGKEFNAYVCLPSISDIRKLWKSPNEEKQLERAAVATDYALSIDSNSKYATDYLSKTDIRRKINYYAGKSPYVLIDPRPIFSINGTKYPEKRVAGVDPQGIIVTNAIDDDELYVGRKDIDLKLKLIFEVDDDFYGVRPMIWVKY